MTLSDNIDDYCFMDFETRALPGVTGTDESVVTAGTYRYARNSYPVLLTWAHGSGAVQCLELGDFSKRFRWDQMPTRLWTLYRLACAGQAWFAAWNMGFDRAVWNHAFPDAQLPPEAAIDVMAQAVASNLPPDLQGASKFIGRGGKQDDGKALINLFARANGGTPQSHPEEWARYKSYAIRDTEELRHVFKATRKLPRREWEEYWASERINERGMKVDLEFCRRAAAIAEADKARTNKLLRQLTDGAIQTIGQTAKLADWLWDRLDSPEARNLMVKEWDEEEGEEIVGKIGLDRSRVQALIAFFKAREEARDGLTDDEWKLFDLLELREFGGSATPLKFAKILQQHDEGRLKGQYVFNGAAQTGRFSSKGVQCVTGDHEILTRAGWQRIDRSVGAPVELMIWDRATRSMRWAFGTVHSFGPAPVVRLRGTVIRGHYTLGHRIPRVATYGAVDTSPACIIASNTKAVQCLISDPVETADMPLTDAELEIIVAMQSDGTWAKRAAVWHISKERKIARLTALLRDAGVHHKISRYAAGSTGIRIATRDVPGWLVKRFGPWCLQLSARQAALVLDVYRHWDGWTHGRNGALCVSSPDKDQMEWLVTLAALAGRCATLRRFVARGGYEHWRVYLRSSVTTTIHAREFESFGEPQPVFCPNTPTGYWLCRVDDRVFVTGNTHNLTRSSLGAAEEDAIETINDLEL